MNRGLTAICALALAACVSCTGNTADDTAAPTTPTDTTAIQVEADVQPSERETVRGYSDTCTTTVELIDTLDQLGEPIDREEFVSELVDDIIASPEWNSDYTPLERSEILRGMNAATTGSC